MTVRFIPYINGHNDMSFDLEYGDTAELAVFLPYGIYDKCNVWR